MAVWHPAADGRAPQDVALAAVAERAIGSGRVRHVLERLFDSGCRPGIGFSAHVRG